MTEELKLSEEELQMRSEVLELFVQMNEVTSGHPMNVVATTLACVFATCIMEVVGPGDDLEKTIVDCMKQMEECVRGTIDGNGPLIVRRDGAN